MQAYRSKPRLTAKRRRIIDRELDALLDLEADQRERRLQALARRTPRVHRVLERLIAASTEPTAFLQDAVDRAGDQALSGLDEARKPLPEGTRVDAWRLVAPVGAGGMGMVYRAERADGAFEMSVAIKFIRSRNDPLMAQRLMLETQLLARLDHPNIARVVDGGTLDDGQNYLVMEWIDGHDLTHLHRNSNTDPARCLKLLVDIADAVGHAHQRQVVHGDIKPANVRLSPDGRPRLLDFGVARLMSGPGSGDAGPKALTPAFSAPEQLEGHPASTQTDIYSLGALLRWMLTGEAGSDGSPVDPARLPGRRSRAVAAVIDKAMARSPDRRYPAVPELMADVRRLLESRPVSARHYGPFARLGLWADRHRAAAALAGLALAAALTAVAGIGWQARIAAAERDAARFEAERSALLREQLVLLFREVGQNAADSNLSTRELLARSRDVARRLHANDPQMLVSIKALLGEIYIAMNDFASAEELLEAFVEFQPNFASPLMQAVVRADLAQIRLRRGESGQALALTAEAIDTLERAPGRNAERVADVMQIQGQALRGLGRWDEAVATLEQALQLARSAPGPSRLHATVHNNLATTLIYAGRAGEALPHLRAALDNWRELELENGSSALTVMANLASLLHQRGRIVEAEPLYREAIRLRTQRYGDSGALAAIHLNLGALLALRYRASEAREHLARGVAMIRRFEGEDSTNYSRALLSRGRAELDLGNHAAAARDLEKADRRFRDAVGPEHLFTSIAGFYAALAEAERIGNTTAELDEAVERLKTNQSRTARHLAAARCAQARLSLPTNADRAIELARACIEIREALAVSEWLLADARMLWIAARSAAGEADLGAAFRAQVATLSATLGEDHPKLRWSERWPDV
jgi:non-specific serine/threonine protein kinase/serine/threonine-protein kinase